MNARVEGWISIAAAILVLFTAMLDPRVSAALAVILLVALAVYQFVFAGKATRR